MNYKLTTKFLLNCLFGVLLVFNLGCASVIARSIDYPRGHLYPGNRLYFGNWGAGNSSGYHLECEGANCLLVPLVMTDIVICTVFDTALLPVDLIHVAVQEK